MIAADLDEILVSLGMGRLGRGPYAPRYCVVSVSQGSRPLVESAGPADRRADLAEVFFMLSSLARSGEASPVNARATTGSPAAPLRARMTRRASALRASYRPQQLPHDQQVHPSGETQD